MGEKGQAEQVFEAPLRARWRLTLIYAASALVCCFGAGVLGWDIIGSDHAESRSFLNLALCAFSASLAFFFLYGITVMRFRVRILESAIEVGTGWTRRTVPCDDVRLIEDCPSILRLHGERFQLSIRFPGYKSWDASDACVLALRERCRNAAFINHVGEEQLPAIPSDPVYPLKGLESYYRRLKWSGIAVSIARVAAGLGWTAWFLYVIMKPAKSLTVYWVAGVVCLLVLHMVFSTIKQTRVHARRLREIRQSLSQEHSAASR
jgi:uncharacterized membrane protein YhaH (DUF805 family)